MLNATEAMNIAKSNKNARRCNENTKMETIKKNIKKRAEKGYYYYDYQASINYYMAKILIENGYKLTYKKDDQFKPIPKEDFIKRNLYGVRISWFNEDIR